MQNGPVIASMKTKYGDEIFVQMTGVRRDETLHFVAEAGGAVVRGITMSPDFLKNTFRPFSITNNVIDNFIPTLRGINDRLDRLL